MKIKFINRQRLEKHNGLGESKIWLWPAGSSAQISNTVVQIRRESLAPASTTCWHLTKQQHPRGLTLRQHHPSAFQVKLDEEGHEERSDRNMIETPGQASRRFFGVMVNEYSHQHSVERASASLGKSWPHSWQTTHGSWAGNKEQLGGILNQLQHGRIRVTFRSQSDVISPALIIFSPKAWLCTDLDIYISLKSCTALSLLMCYLMCLSQWVLAGWASNCLMTAVFFTVS